MDFIITFFRDILDGPVYTIVTVISSIFICASIGYLAEKKQREKKEKEQYVEAPVVSQAVPSSIPATSFSVSAPPSAPEVTTFPSPSTSPESVGVAYPTTAAGPVVQIDQPPVGPIPSPADPVAVLSPQIPSTAPAVQGTATVQSPGSVVLQAPNLNQNSEVPTSVNQG